jgi:hypothetical protein
MLVNGRKVSLVLEGDESKWGEWIGIVRNKLIRLLRVCGSRPFKKYIGDGDAEVVVEQRPGGHLRARINIPTGSYPQIGEAVLESAWNDVSPISRTLFDIIKVNTQPGGTPVEYGTYGFTKRRLVAHAVWGLDTSPETIWTQFYHKDELWLLYYNTAYKAKVKENKALDTAYPGGYSFGANYAISAQYSLPHYDPDFLGKSWYNAIPVNRGYWYNYIANVSGLLTEADFVGGGSSTPVHVLYNTELIGYNKTESGRSTLQTVSGLWVYNSIPSDVQTQAMLAANDQRVFYVGVNVPWSGGGATAGSDICVSYSDLLPPSSTVDTHNVVVYTTPFDGGSMDDLINPWGVQYANATADYLYIVVGRLILGASPGLYEYRSKLLIVDARTLAFVQVFDTDGTQEFRMQYMTSSVAVASEIVYTQGDGGLPNPGVIINTVVFDVAIAPSGIHAFTVKHRHVHTDTTVTGSGTGIYFNERQANTFVNTHGNKK